MLGEEKWRERCERYFSSITDIHKEADKAANAKANLKPDGKKKKDKSPKRQTGKKKHPQDSDEIKKKTTRTTKETMKQTTMKKTTEDRVLIRANGEMFRSKRKPFKGPRRWLSSLDLHGTSMLQRTETFLYFFVWVLISLGGCALFGYLLYLVIGNYLDSSTHFKVSVQEGSADLPLAVTVCNLNPLRRNHLATTRFAGLLSLNASTTSTNFQQVQPTDLSLLLQRSPLQRFLQREEYASLDISALLQELQQEYPVYGAMMTDDDWASLYSASLGAGHYDVFARALRVTRAEMSSLDHHMPAAMVQCLKNGHRCDSSNVTYSQVTEHGNCVTVTLNTASYNWFDTLSLIFDVEPEEYVTYVTSSRAMAVFVHDVDSGIWRSERFFAPAGHSLNLHVAKITDVTRRYSSCHNDENYNQNQCFSACFEEETAAVCGCTVTVSAPVSQRCRPNIQYEFICSRLIERFAKMGKLKCNCPSNCRDYKFDVQVSQVPWPSQDYEAHLRRSFLEQGIIKPFDNIRESLAKIQLSVGHTQYMQMEEEKDVTLLQLLIQIGAVSALTVGVSVITGVEIVWMICRLFCLCVKAAWRGRQEHNQVQAMSTGSYPEFDDLGFNWFSLQGQDTDRNAGRGPVMVSDTEMTPPLAPNLLGLDPIVEENDVDIRAVDGAEDSNPRDLFSHPWERSGQSRPYTRVLVSGKDANISDAPLLNAPGLNASLRSEMYRPSADSAAFSGRAATNSAEKGHVRTSSSGGGNYILKTRAPFSTWHSQSNFATSHQPHRQPVMTPADFITVYGKPARQLYDDEDNNPGFYLP